MTITPERWADIKAVFNAAVALAGPARTAYLAAACAGDPTLRQHVDSLLASHDQAESFLETPPAGVLQVERRRRRQRVDGWLGDVNRGRDPVRGRAAASRVSRDRLTSC